MHPWKLTTCNLFVKSNFNKVRVVHYKNTMPVFHFVVLILSLVFLPNIYNRMECLDRISLRRFYKIRSCHRSNTTIIGAGNFENITQCIKFARERNGLALNFSPSPRNPRSHLYSRLNGYSFNCQILECPEVGNMTTLVKDTNYDYYSLYGILNGKMHNIIIQHTYTWIYLFIFYLQLPTVQIEISYNILQVASHLCDMAWYSIKSETTTIFSK